MCTAFFVASVYLGLLFIFFSQLSFLFYFFLILPSYFLICFKTILSKKPRLWHYATRKRWEKYKEQTMVSTLTWYNQVASGRLAESCFSLSYFSLKALKKKRVTQIDKCYYNFIVSFISVLLSSFSTNGSHLAPKTRAI